MMDHGIVDKEGVWRSPSLAQIVRATASVTAGLLMAMAIIAVWRRCAGAFRMPLSFETLLCVGVVAVGPTFAVRQWWRSVTSSQPISSLELVWTLCTPSVSLLVILWAISVPGTSTWGLFGVGLLFLTGEVAVYRSPRWLDLAKITSRTMPILDRADAKPESLPFDAGPVGVVSHDDVECDEVPEPHVSQQLVRCRTEEGWDCLKGWIRVDIPTGHRSQNVHLAFCPAFEKTPEIEVHPEEGLPSCRMKIVQSLPYGVHFEVKLPKPSSKDETLAFRFRALADLIDK